jgi:hypothetical protein
MQIGQVRQEVVTDKDTHEDKVIDDALKRVLERNLGREGRELKVEVFAQQGQMEEEEVGVGEADR